MAPGGRGVLIRISYPLRRDSPVYPGTPGLSMVPHRSMERGDSSNTNLITLSSHAGTHIDAPLHFCPGAASISDLCSGSLSFGPAWCLGVPKVQGKPLVPADLTGVTRLPPDTSAILVRTGSFLNRIADPDGYATHHPWVDPSVPIFLRSAFPSLRIFGLDAISISEPGHRQEGRECHRAFLCGSPPILVLEDLDLSDARLTDREGRLHLFPFITDELDGVPVVALFEPAADEEI